MSKKKPTNDELRAALATILHSPNGIKDMLTMLLIRKQDWSMQDILRLGNTLDGIAEALQVDPVRLRIALGDLQITCHKKKDDGNS
jgi:hypothetical protein